jgi:death-on-curing protein
MQITWLDEELVKELNKEALYEGEPHGLNPGSDLQGVIYRPQSWAYYREVRSLYKLAAIYVIAITKGHPFRDGNKRTAVLAASTFLHLNGLELDLSNEDEVFDLITSAAEGREDGDDSLAHNEVERVADWIRRNTEGAT